MSWRIMSGAAMAFLAGCLIASARPINVPDDARVTKLEEKTAAIDPSGTLPAANLSGNVAAARISTALGTSGASIGGNIPAAAMSNGVITAIGQNAGRIGTANLATNVVNSPQGYSMKLAIYQVTAAAPQATVAGFSAILFAIPQWQGTGVTNIVNPSAYAVGATNVTVVPGSTETNAINVLVGGW